MINKGMIRMWSLVIVLCVVFISCFDLLAEDSQHKEIKKLEAAQSAVSFSVSRPVVNYQAFDLKDPFLWPQQIVTDSVGQEVVQEIKPPELTIQGIVWGGEIPQAIIDGKVMHIGDVVSNAHIVDISKKGVDIFFEGRQFTIPAPASSCGAASKISSKGGSYVQ